MKKNVALTTDTTGDFFILLCMSAFVVVLMAKAVTYTMMMQAMYSQAANQPASLEQTVIERSIEPAQTPQKNLRSI